MDFPLQTDIQLPHNWPDILIDHQEKTGSIIDVAVPRNENIKDKEMEMIDKYQPLNIELERLWEVKITVTTIMIGALGAMPDTQTSPRPYTSRNRQDTKVCTQTPRALVVAPSLENSIPLTEGERTFFSTSYYYYYYYYYCYYYLLK